MRKALAIAVVATSLTGGATVAPAQSSRNLMDVTGTRRTARGPSMVLIPLGLAPTRMRRAYTGGGIGPTLGAGDSTAAHRLTRSQRATVRSDLAIGRSPNSRGCGRNSTNTSTGLPTATSAQYWRQRRCQGRRHRSGSRSRAAEPTV